MFYGGYGLGAYGGYGAYNGFGLGYGHGLGYHGLHHGYGLWQIIPLKSIHFFFKNCIYSNYITFIRDLCITHESTKCKNILNNFLKEQGFTENQHKKNIVKHIRWKTQN